jgi:hypothetical protein
MCQNIQDLHLPPLLRPLHLWLEDDSELKAHTREYIVAVNAASFKHSPMLGLGIQTDECHS